MSKISIENVKEKYETGMKAMSDAIESAKDISIHPKFSASLSVKSEKSGLCGTCSYWRICCGKFDSKCNFLVFQRQEKML